MTSGISRWAQAALLLAALLLLNAALTFHNVWPTPAIELRGEWSVEIAALVLGLALWLRHRDGLTRRAEIFVAVLLGVFVLARYAEVTAPALYGRAINLYWDAQHVGGVVAMLARVAEGWQLLAALAVVLIAFAFLGAMLRACLRRVAAALSNGPILERRVLLGAAASVVVLFAVDRVGGIATLPFSIPVTQTWARQFALIGGSWLQVRRGDRSGSEEGGVAVMRDLPVLTQDAASRTDVSLVFIESYGEIAFSRPEIAQGLVGSRAQLAESIARTGRGVVSAYVRSPTFGSGSWLAHSSLLSGVEIRDGDDYARLMMRARPTLGDVFRAQGYRILALMPGLRQAWPEGKFYSFDEIYGATRLDYRGPEFGWWRIPDQFAIAQYERFERAAAPQAPPRFLFFPTISSHMPFRPTPPYQPDWARLTGPSPYGDEAARAIAQPPEWTNLAPAYSDSIAYAQRSIAGWLEQRRGQPLVLWMLGDHQPPAAVSGEGASWNVPVHVISDRPDVLDALLARGFVRGLTPAGEALGPMHELAPLMIESLGSPSGNR